MIRWTGRLLSTLGLDVARLLLDAVQGLVFLLLLAAAVLFWPGHAGLAWLVLLTLAILAFIGLGEILSRRIRPRSNAALEERWWHDLAIRATATALLSVGAALGVWFATRPFEIMLPAAEVQRRVDARLPLEGGRGPLRWTVSTARVKLRPDGRVAVNGGFRAEAFGRALDGSLLASGRLAYRSGAFFLDNVVVEDLAAGRGAQLRPEAVRAPEGISELAREAAYGAVAAALERLPVYRLREDGAHNAVARAALRDVAVRDGRIVATLDPLTGVSRLFAYVLGAVVLMLSATVLLAMIP